MAEQLQLGKRRYSTPKCQDGGPKAPNRKESRRHQTEERKTGSEEPWKGTMTEGIERKKKERVRERMKATETEEVSDGDATWR